jgi:histidine triad (HIT) family protein
MPEQKEYSEEELKNMSAEEIAELQKQNCIFCKIASKEIPSKIVHEDPDVICVLDINPASEGHILVFPKKHYMIMPHIPDDILSKVFKNVKLMSNTLLQTLQCKGTTVFVANGVAAGQKAPHVLIHVFPRRENDDLVKLPQYEMNDEQIAKLKSTLKPYLTQVFGRSNIKEAEFTEKRHVKEEIEKQEGDEEAETPDVEKKVAVKKPEKKNEPEKKKNTKVDLDDIARLFG